MTSAHFTLVPISSILFDDSQRQRGELTDIEPLMESIKSIGLINPPLITRDHQLIAGRRRLEAVTRLGWLEVPIQYSDEIEPHRLHLVELEENAKRKDLTWQEFNAAVTRYHALRRQDNPEWTQEDTAEALNISRMTVSEHLLVARMAEAVPELKVMEAEQLSTAIGLARRASERREGSVLEQLVGAPTAAPAVEPLGEAPAPAPAAEAPVPKGLIFQANFLEWKQPLRFNFIHCDFPYGIDTGSKTRGQSGTKTLGTYDDSAGVYWALLEHLCKRTRSLCEPQAHLMFWLSMRFYTETKRELEQAGWKVDPFPFIWGKSDNSGIIPDSNRGPRRGYECALFASLGDRKIVRPVSNFFAAPTPREVHAHQKPHEMLLHFFRMIVDGSTKMLDPTCGSGSAIKAGVEAGAARAIGLELNEEFAERARKFIAG